MRGARYVSQAVIGNRRPPEELAESSGSGVPRRNTYAPGDIYIQMPVSKRMSKSIEVLNCTVL